MIDHTLYDHASIPATIERLFGMGPMTNRDAAANDVLHLLSREAPRADAPTQLPEPEPSGWRCENDPEVVEVSVAGRGPEPSGEASEPPLEPSVRQAMQLAARARIGTLRKWDAYGRLAVLEELGAIRDDQDARQFILRGRERVRRWRTQRGERARRGYTRMTRTSAR